MMQIFLSIPPGFYAVLASFLMMNISHRPTSRLVAIAVALWVVIDVALVVISPPEEVIWNVAGFLLKPLTVHPFTPILAVTFSLVLFFGVLFSMQRYRKQELEIAFFYGGMGLNVLFAGDLISFLLFWEFMTIGGTALIWSNETDASFKSGLRYGLVHLFGGVLLLCSVALLVDIQHSTAIPVLSLDIQYWSDPEHWMQPITIATLLFFIGLSVNVAVPPLSAWLPDSYPAASPEASVFLSAFTTKSAILFMIMIFSGSDVLIYLGGFMVVYASIYALIEDEVRRVLSYSLIQQLGVMLMLIGIGTPLALQVTILHACAHIIYKALLFMGAGALVLHHNEESCLKLGGGMKSFPLVGVAILIGTLTASGFPLTLAFLSKSMMGEATAKSMWWVPMILTFSGIMGFLHTGVKLSWFMVLKPRRKKGEGRIGAWMQWAMVGLAVLCILPGMFPVLAFLLLPGNGSLLPDPYSVGTVGHQLTYGLISVIAFILALPAFNYMRRIPYDFDWIYRNLCYQLVLLCWKTMTAIHNLCWDPLYLRLSQTRSYIIHAGERMHGVMRWPLGWQLMMFLTIFAVFLVVFYH